MYSITPLMQEFMIAMDMSRSGDPEEKLRWAFKMYDKDNSGKSKTSMILEHELRNLI